MGAGKSTIGKRLSTELDMIFYDTDKEIEKKERMTINDIFKKFGENYFRKLEESLIIKLLEKKEHIIISMGGGAFLNQLIRNKIKTSSISLWLDADINTIFNRIKNSRNTRPIASKLNSKEEMENLLNKRKKIYREADISINITSLGKTEILKLSIKKIIAYLEKKNEKAECKN